MALRALTHWPALYCAVLDRIPDRHPVQPDTDLVIEGYQGAANSFAREAFLVANPRARVASHLHSTAQLKRARQLQVPALVLLRPPAPSITSLVARNAGTTHIGDELRRYRAIYRYLLTDDWPLLATFDEVTGAFGAVIRRVNERFGTSFVPFDDASAQSRAQVAAIMEGWTRHVRGEKAGVGVALPSRARREAHALVAERLQAPRYAERLARCDGLYAQVLARAERGRPDG